MKKTWTNAEVSELNVSATMNTPTTELKADDVIVGKGYQQGVREGSGPEYPIPYYPNTTR